MAGAEWSIALGVVIYLIAIIAAAVYYYRFKKIYLIFHITALATYIFSVFYTWDVFDLGNNQVLGLLFLSTIVMIFLGRYFKNFDIKVDKPHTSLKEKNE